MRRRKRKRDVQKKAQMYRRNVIRKRMGKKVFFTLTHCNKKLNGISNRFNYKSNIHALCFTGSRFYNVKYQASIITKCNFRGAQLIGTDFYNCNLKDSSFKNAKLEDVVFYNCNLSNTDFENAHFSDVTFICTKLDCANSLNINVEGITVLKTYPKLNIDDVTEKALLDAADKQSVFEAKVIHVSKKKLNNWNLSVIQSRCGEQSLKSLGKILSKKEKWNNLYTVYSFVLLIDNWVRK